MSIQSRGLYFLVMTAEHHKHNKLFDDSENIQGRGGQSILSQLLSTLYVQNVLDVKY